MVEQSYGSWDQASPDYNAGYSDGQTGDGVFYDPKTGNYYGIIRSRLRTGSSGILGSKGSKYGSMQKDVYILGEDQLDSFRAFYKKYDGGKIKGSNDYGKAAKQFTRLAYQKRDDDGNILNPSKKNTLTGLMETMQGTETPYDMSDFQGELGDPGKKPSMDTAGLYGRGAAPDEDYEAAWLDQFEGQSASYRGETTAGQRGQARKTELQKRDYARKRYADQMYNVPF